MLSRLAERSTRLEKESYKRHIDNLKNVQPKVENNAPLLNVSAFYRMGKMTKTAVALTRIEEENFRLLKNINFIYRSKGKIDCFKPKSMDTRMPNFESVVKRGQQIYRENVKLLDRIVHAKSRIDFDKIRKDQKENVNRILILSKHPEYYKKIVYHNDPLAVRIPENVYIKKSKCYLDIKDLTENESLGRLTIEVYDGIVPMTARNFLELCRVRADGTPNYRGTPFFHIVPDLFCIGGDVEYSIGLGGVSALNGGYFDDEKHTLSHNAPGTLSMYNFEKNKNASQFLITFKPLTTLDYRYVVFGRVVGGLYTLRLIENLGYSSGKPKHKVIIADCGVLKR